MFIADDPMLALIMRFVSKGESPNISDKELMQRQVAAINDYIAQFPDEERTQRAMEWIEKYAEEYRKEWQRNTATRVYSDKRCPDCPLIADGTDTHCEIHERWLALLENYANNNMTSAKYVEDALRLLEEHKAQLQINASFAANL